MNKPPPVQLSTEPIEITVTTGVPFDIEHGLGRQIQGFMVVWATDYVAVKPVNPAADSSKMLRLVANNSVTLRIVLL